MENNTKNILITSISGFVGIHTADFLLSNTDYKIYGQKRLNLQLRNIRYRRCWIRIDAV